MAVSVETMTFIVERDRWEEIVTYLDPWGPGMWPPIEFAGLGKVRVLSYSVDSDTVAVEAMKYDESVYSFATA